MENNEKVFLNDNLISPAKLLEKKVIGKVKVITTKDGLVERTNSKVVTPNGKELLTEVNNRIIL